MKNRIPFAIPDISHEEIEEVVLTLKNGWLTYGPKTIQFEEEFKNYIGCRHALAVNSATSGLHLSLIVLGIGSGDKVVVPVNTFTSTANVIAHLGATPIFCDIDSKTFNIDTKKLEEILSSDTNRKIKVVMPVHIAGQAAEMDTILNLRKQHGFKILEDAAHALPTTYNKQMIGTIGDITVFSFYPTKTLGTCDGGMVCTNNDEWAKGLKILRYHGIDSEAIKGIDRPWDYNVEELGYKYNMNDVAASIAIHQLRRATEFLKRRTTIASYYDDHLKNIASIEIPYIRNTSDVHSRHLYIIKTANRDEVAKKLYDQGIMTSVHFKPLHLHSYWRERFQFNAQDFPKANALFGNILSLPIHTKLTDADVENIVRALKNS